MAQETEQLELSHENIVTFISENIPDCKDVTIGKLKSPTSELVQTVYCKILLEFGFSESIINLQQAEFDLLDEVGEYIDLYKTMLPVISLKVACVNLLTLINGDTTFGISDLLDPHPKRTQRFLSCLVNFWTFCNSTYEHVNKVSEDVEQVVAFKKNLEQRNEDYRNKINSYKHKAAEEAEATRLAQEDIDQLQMKTAQLMEYKETIDSINQKLKKDLEEESIATAAIEAEITKLETERDNVQGAVHFDAARERLDVELATLKEEVNLKVQMKIDRNSKLSQLDQTSNILKSILEVAHLYSNEQQHIRDFNGKIQEINVCSNSLNPFSYHFSIG